MGAACVAVNAGVVSISISEAASTWPRRGECAQQASSSSGSSSRPGQRLFICNNEGGAVG